MLSSWIISKFVLPFQLPGISIVFKAPDRFTPKPTAITWVSLPNCAVDGKLIRLFAFTRLLPSAYPTTAPCANNPIGRKNIADKLNNADMTTYFFDIYI